MSGQWTLDNYARLREPQYFQVLVNSLRLAALTTLLCALIGYPFGYLMARLKPASRSIVTLLLVVPFWTNSLIRIYGWRILLIGNGPINTLLMNLGWIQQPLKLLNTEGAVFLGMVYALVPFMILPSSTAVEKLDYSVVEAAPGSGRQPAARLFHRNRAPDPVWTDGGLRAGVHPLHGAVLLKRPAGRQQDHAGGQSDSEPDEMSRDLPWPRP